MVSLLGVLLAARALFRPLPSLVPLPDLAERARAADVIRRHGHDTLAFFKLRSDKHYLWSSDRRAFVGYRVESRVMLISGDPVGPRDSVPHLLAETVDHARRRDLRLAVVGASQQMRDACAEVGMKTLYIGDEAIVDTRPSDSKAARSGKCGSRSTGSSTRAMRPRRSARPTPRRS